MKLLGLSAYHADAAAAAVVDGRFVAGVEEERFRRVKHWAGFPEQALGWCAKELGGRTTPASTRSRSRASRAPTSARKAWLALTPSAQPRRGPPARVKNLHAVAALERAGREGPLGPASAPRDHRRRAPPAHLASAFYCSPFEEAACLSVDGFGDFVSTMLAHGRGNRIEVLDRVHFPHSLGLFYSAMTQYLGFPHFGDEYKVMGLAAYGEPRFVGEIGAARAGAAGRHLPARPAATSGISPKGST